MAYGMEQLRKAGQALRGFDDAYSQKIGDMHAKLIVKDDGNLRGGPIGGIALALGSAVGGSIPSTRKYAVEKSEAATGLHKRLEDAAAPILEYGLPAASATSKYVLPAAGVTLAGKGLIDMANVIGQQTSTTLEPN